MVSAIQSNRYWISATASYQIHCKMLSQLYYTLLCQQLHFVSCNNSYNVFLTDIHFEHESYSFDEADGNVTLVVKKTTLVFEPAFNVQVYGGKQCAHFLFVQCTNSTLTTEVNALVLTLQVPMLSHLNSWQWVYQALKLM